MLAAARRRIGSSKDTSGSLASSSSTGDVEAAPSTGADAPLVPGAHFVVRLESAEGLDTQSTFVTARCAAARGV
jgi:hypothetical protein